MPKSLHLVHAGKKARGDLTKQKPPLTLAQIRQKNKLPFTPDHTNMDELRKAINQLNMN